LRSKKKETVVTAVLYIISRKKALAVLGHLGKQTNTRVKVSDQVMGSQIRHLIGGSIDSISTHDLLNMHKVNPGLGRWLATSSSRTITRAIQLAYAIHASPSDL
jgi:hypothetical protein